MKKVLVTDISSYKAIVFCMALSGFDKISVVTADHRSFTRCIRTKYAGKHYIYPDFHRYPDQFISRLEEIIETENIDCLIPVNSEQMRICLKNKSRFGKTLDLFGDYKTFCKLDDKEQLYNISKLLNVKIPERYSLNDGSINFPLVFKPTISASSKGIQYIINKKELDKLKKRIKTGSRPFILQQYIKGEGVGYSVLCDKGKIIAACGHKRIAEYPVSGGPSVIRESYDHHDMAGIAQKIIRFTEWTGLAMFEFKLTDQNEICLIEINPRIWGSINQSVQSGINFPYLLLTKEYSAVTSAQKSEKIMTSVPFLSLMSVLLYIFKVWNFQPMGYYLKNYRRIIPDVSFMNDIKGYFSVFLLILHTLFYKK